MGRHPDFEPAVPLLTDDAVSGALAALRLVLHARWNYFNGIAAAVQP